MKRCRVLVLQPAVQCNGRDGGLASFYTSDLAGGIGFRQGGLDFGFWKEKVDQAVAEFKLYLMLPKTVSQTEGMILGGKTVCAGGGSCFLYLLWKVFI